MADFSPRARQTSRGQHPDLTDSGDLKADTYLPVAERDFWRRWQDPVARQHILAQMAAQQRQEPVAVQQLVQGKSFGTGANPYAGMQQYRAAIEEARGVYAAMIGANVSVDDREIENMSMAEYEQFFDPAQGGAPRPGVIVNHTNRAVRLDDGISR